MAELLEGTEDPQVVRLLLGEGAERPQDGRGLLHRVQGAAVAERADRAQLQREGGDHTEVAGAAAQGAHQVGVTVVGRPDHRAVRQHHLGLDDVVAGQAPLAGEPAVAAAERQAAEAGVADHAGRAGQTVRGGRGVEVLEQTAALGAGQQGLRVDGDAPQQREVDHHGVVVDGRPGDVVAAAAHGRGQSGGPGEADGGGDVGGAAAARDQGGAAVVHAVPDLAGLVVSLVRREQQLPLEGGAQLVERDGEARREVRVGDTHTHPSSSGRPGRAEPAGGRVCCTCCTWAVVAAPPGGRAAGGAQAGPPGPVAGRCRSTGPGPGRARRARSGRGAWQGRRRRTAATVSAGPGAGRRRAPRPAQPQPVSPPRAATAGCGAGATTTVTVGA